MPSLGHQLRKVREQHGLTEDEVAIDTCISASTIRSLENDDYAHFDSPIYAKNFLKTYSKYLGLNISETLSKFDQIDSGSETIFRNNRQQLEDTARPEEVSRSRNPLILAPVLVGIFGFLCLCLFSLVTGGSLPFAPSDAPQAENPTPAAAKISSEPRVIPEKTEVLIPVQAVDNKGVTVEDGGPYIDDLQASTTVYLKTSRAQEVHVLP